MENVNITRNGNRLTIEIDLTTDLGPSSTGKTRTVATTRGNATIPGTTGYKIGLNVFRYPDANLSGGTR